MPTTLIHDIYRHLLFSLSGVLFPREKHHVGDFVSHTWPFLVYISHHVRSILNIIWLISYHIPRSSWYHFQCISYVIDHANYFNSWYIPTSAFFTLGRSVSPWKTSCGWFRITYLAVPGIHITSCEIDEEHHVVDFVSHTWQIIHFKKLVVHIIRYSLFVFKN